MIQIIGVRFRKSGKVYYFSPTGMEIAKGNHVIVETVRGVEYGTVVLGPKEVTDDKIVQPLKPVIRVATPEDDAANLENEAREKEAFDICLEKIAKHELNMKLIDSEYTFDRNKLLFYFTADGRIDFRELVKDLAAIFRTRIELRQIGVRDETKMLGGIAICGRPLCCHTFLSDFAPVSIKMAKEQNLSLNPAKISGVCGRLMCCLKNEEEAYEYLNSRLPNIGTKVNTIDGYVGEVQNVSVLKQRVKLIISHDNDEKEVKEYSVDDLSFKNHRRSFQTAPANPLPDEEIDENALRELEQMELQDLEDSSIEDGENSPKNYNRKKKPYNNKNQRGTPRNGEDGYRQNQRGNYRNAGDDYKQNRRNSYRSNEDDTQSQRNSYRSNGDSTQSQHNGYRSNGDSTQSQHNSYRSNEDSTQSQHNGYRSNGDGTQGQHNGYRSNGEDRQNQRNSYRSNGDGTQGQHNGYRSNGEDRQNQHSNYQNNEGNRQNPYSNYYNGDEDRQNQRNSYHNDEGDRTEQRNNYHNGGDDTQSHPSNEAPKKPYYKKNYNRGQSQNSYSNNDHTESGTGRKYGRSKYRNNSRSYSNRNKKR